MNEPLLPLHSRALRALRLHCRREWPREAGGVIRNGGFEPLPNLHPEPDTHWEFEVDDLDGVEAVVHSHPDGCAWPSKMDMRAQIALGLPHGIVVLPRIDGPCGRYVDPYGLVLGKPWVSEVFWWPDGGMPYLGRPYRHGVTDCLQLVRDWLRRERGIEVPPFAYDWGEGDRLVAGAEELNWESVEPAAAAAGDVVLLGRGKPTHCGVLLEGGLLLHHPGAKPWDPTCLSRREPAARLSRLVVGVVRPA